jgi:NADH-quinone oxidoreductase subunit J
MSIGDAILAAFIIVLGAVGTYLLLPHRHGLTRPRIAHGAGAIAASVGLLVFLTLFSPPGGPLTTLFHYVFSLAAIISGLLTITSRNPIYSALWFASVVLATSGLFLLAGAPFLAAGTVIVYAGAIIVTFLFVIMLAQAEGKAEYDRAARSPGRATFTCYLLLWCLIYSLSTIRPMPVGNPTTEEGRLQAERLLRRPTDIISRQGITTSQVVMVVDRVLTQTSQIREPVVSSSNEQELGAGESNTVEKANVAGLGTSLYTDHLVTVGLAGALLFVALIAAVSIANPKPPGRAGVSVSNPARTATTVSESGT